MCIAAPGKVLNIDGRKATILYAEESRMAMVGEVIPAVGDYVLVQMGVVMKILSKKEASEAMKGWGKKLS